MKRMLIALVAFYAANCMVLAGESLDFTSEPVTAGRASLVDHGYVVARTLGEVAFFPELKFPIQLIYRSSSGKDGAFGYGWTSPQLESTVLPEANGVVWVTPWGERVQFSAKKESGFFSLFSSKSKGRGYFAPYENWEANTSATGGNVATSGNWTLTGRYKYTGWKFVYRDSRLMSVTAPSGRSLTFAYAKDGLASVTGENQTLLELTYDEKRVSRMMLNGVLNIFAYTDVTLQIAPQNPNAPLETVAARTLGAVQTGKLNPVQYDYDSHGYLIAMRQGDYKETLDVRHETLAERREKSQAAGGRLAGNLVEDANYQYARSGAGNVRLTDKKGRTAAFNYDTEKGIYKIVDFSGKSITGYYFLRYDVAYLGWIRQAVDNEGRVIASFRYDKDTGNVTRIRDMAGNDVEYAYTDDGLLARVTRRGVGNSRPEPLVRIDYDAKRNPSAVMRLDAKGNAVLTTRLVNDANGQPASVTDGRSATAITYTRQGFPATITDTFGRVTRVRYDAHNRCVQMTTPAGIQMDITYDDTGLVTAITRSFKGRAMAAIHVAYDANGRAISYKDHRGREKRLERDAFGRVVREIFPDASSVAYAFTSLCQLSQVTDQNGHALAFEWGRFGLASKATAAGQLTGYTYDHAGRLTRIDSRFNDAQAVDRSIALAYDKLDRLTSVSYGAGQVQTMAYDNWGKVTQMSNHGVTTRLSYDYFGRLIEKREGKTVETYAYNPWGQRVERVTKTGNATLREKREYDRYGRLAKITGDEGTIAYTYNNGNQIAEQWVNDTKITYTYTPEGWLDTKSMYGLVAPIATLKYYYAPDGQIIGRLVNNARHHYRYDDKDQLVAVLDAQLKPLETYAYDPAGNLLQKTIAGVTTTYTYDAANQLVTSEENGEVTLHYAYDAAGRMIKEGDKTYRYGWLDKVLAISENGTETASFSYHASGQLATAAYADKTENFLWDGLALIQRDGMGYLNEPHAGGGAPVLAGKKVLFNDLLGSTLGIKGASQYQPVTRTAFGETDQKTDEFFTGKPNVDGLGYAFLLRNYSAKHAKWQTTDPLGYPDGWNNLAYVNNQATSAVDWLGAEWVQVMDSGIPSTPLTEIIQGAKFDRIYGTMEYYTIISYEWVQFAFHSEANTSTTPKTFEFKTSLSQKITRSAGASINATLKGFGLSLTGSIAYEDSTELTITVPLTVGSMEKLDYYRYQLVATYIVYEVWTPFYTSESTTTAFYQTTVPLLSSAGREVRYKWETPPQE